MPKGKDHWLLTSSSHAGSKLNPPFVSGPPQVGWHPSMVGKSIGLPSWQTEVIISSQRLSCGSPKSFHAEIYTFASVNNLGIEPRYISVLSSLYNIESKKTLLSFFFLVKYQIQITCFRKISMTMVDIECFLKLSDDWQSQWTISLTFNYFQKLK